MTRYSRSHLDDHALKLSLGTRAGGERAAMAEFLADIAEFDARRLYVPAGYDSMYANSLRELRLSEDAAVMRIRSARAARLFPEIFPALAEGRLSLTAVFLLSRHVCDEHGNRVPGGQELVAAAMDKTKGEIQRLIAERFPQPDLPSRLEALPAAPTHPTSSPVPERVNGHPGEPDAIPRPKVAPLSAQSFLVQVTIPKSAHDKLRYIQTLLGHAVPTGDLAEVHERAYDALIAQLEKQKYAVTARPRPQGSSVDPRHIPAAVKRAVLERDGGKCTFVGEGGHLCGSQRRLQFDHIDPVAIGGEATVDNIRLRCRAHNLYEAERIFGAGFMETKREAARQAAADKRERTAAEKQARAEEQRARAEEKRAHEAEERDPDRSVVPWLRQLGCGLEDAREAADFCATMPPEATIEARIRAALRFLSARRGRSTKSTSEAA
jgi:5-methylcytosine-specific restriction endonuclease McrA